MQLHDNKIPSLLICPAWFSSPSNQGHAELPEQRYQGVRIVRRSLAFQRRHTLERSCVGYLLHLALGRPWCTDGTRYSLKRLRATTNLPETTPPWRKWQTRRAQKKSAKREQAITHAGNRFDRAPTCTATEGRAPQGSFPRFTQYRDPTSSRHVRRCCRLETP